MLQVIEWFEEYAEEFFQTHTELGDSFDVATALSQEVEHFESSTQVCVWVWFLVGYVSILVYLNIKASKAPFIL